MTSPEGSEKNWIESLGLQHLVPEFLQRRADEVIQMQALLAKADFETLARLAHSLKGSGSNYGFPRLTDVGGRLEKAALVSDATLCAQLLVEYSNELKNK